MPNLGKFLIAIGIFITLMGLGLVIFSRLKMPFLGRLPGDIFIQRKNFSFYFPLASSVLISIIFSIIFYFFSKK